MLAGDDIQVVGTARDGIDALEKIPTLKPDIITLDIEMPRMDGLTCLKRIMAENPLPVLMLSSLTQEGAKATLDALALGALDFISKDTDSFGGDGNIMAIKEDLYEKVKKLARSPKFKLKHLPPTPAGSHAATTTQSLPVVTAPKAGSSSMLPSYPKAEMIVLGCSTGGPKALQEFLPFLPKNLPVPMLIVQHMPASFTKPFAERLNGISQLNIKEATDGDFPEAGHVYIAPGGVHMHLRHRYGKPTIELNPDPPNTLHRPSVDVLFQSAFESCSFQLLSVILTGMGNDGAQGMQKLKQKGAYTMAEAESSCVVYGMPKSANDLGCVDLLVPIQDMAGIIKQHFQI
jgi:two-component system chemotaxis response regulator CheB